ncbi:FG-GAP repeat domain-containing protein [Algibacillus agarilyticus]|uniref:FG-GAP repeat domain-containing protein n=1 Tax=Algibacillus agarilyticus TaxID=2234133 RepID=UPI000DD0907C|nr:VCBS repeat-containing protein [Algibacillus agarilyticus]
MSLLRINLGLILCLIHLNVLAKLTYHEHEITLPFNISQPSLIANLDGLNESEIISIGIDKNNVRWLAISQFSTQDKRFKIVDVVQIPDAFFFLDVSQNKQQQYIYALAKNEVYQLVYKPEQPLSFKPILQLETMYRANKSAFTGLLNFSVDVNHDDCQDFSIPYFDTYHVWLGQCEQGHTPQSWQKITIQTTNQLNINNGYLSYITAAIFNLDFNQDELKDLIAINENTLDIHLQTPAGSYNTTPIKVNINKRFNALNWWDKREADGRSLDQSNLTYRVIDAIDDINGDGIIDIVVRYTKSSGVLDKTNDYEFYFGQANGQAVKFAEKPNTVISATDTLSDLKIIDLNNDNKKEIIVSAFDIGVSEIVSALISGSIAQDVLIFALSDGRFESEPLDTFEVEINFSLTKGTTGQPVVKLIDLNGDKTQDLILSNDENELEITMGQVKSHSLKRIYENDNQALSVTLPQNADNIVYTDLNHDKKIDLFINYGRLDKVSNLNKLKILMFN